MPNIFVLLDLVQPLSELTRGGGLGTPVRGGNPRGSSRGIPHPVLPISAAFIEAPGAGQVDQNAPPQLVATCGLV